MKNKIFMHIRGKTFFSWLFSYFLYKINFIEKTCFGKIKEYTVYRRISKKYKVTSQLENKINECKINSKINYQKTIWIFWYQGFDNAPVIVKKCFESMKTNFPSYDIIALNKSNYSDYVTLPDYILKKLDEGKMTVTHFSDILRAALLYNYGGLWVDATTFCTGKNELSCMQNYELFVYREGWFDDCTINMASWIMWSQPHNKIIGATLGLLYSYWEKNNFLCDYFLFHLFFRMATNFYKDEWENVPYLSQINNHLLVNELQKPYIQERYDQIKKLTDFHKLTYKTSFTSNSKNTFYAKLIKERE